MKGYEKGNDVLSPWNESPNIWMGRWNRNEDMSSLQPAGDSIRVEESARNHEMD